MKAKFILEKPINQVGAIQRLYKTNPPLDGNKYVIVSAVMAILSGPETFIFPSNKDGDITEFGELNGSYKGGLSHQIALENAGYEVIE